MTTVPRGLFHVSHDPIPPDAPINPYSLDATASNLYNLLRWTLTSDPASLRPLLLMDRYVSIRFENVKPALPSLAIEAVFEHVREEHLPSRPSRFGPVFCWETLDLAQRFRSYEKYQTGATIYECRVLEGTTFRADMALINTGFDLLAPPDDELRRMKQRAEHYWSTTAQMELPEIMIRGRVVATTQVDPAP